MCSMKFPFEFWMLVTVVFCEHEHCTMKASVLEALCSPWMQISFRKCEDLELLELRDRAWVAANMGNDHALFNNNNASLFDPDFFQIIFLI